MPQTLKRHRADVAGLKPKYEWELRIYQTYSTLSLSVSLDALRREKQLGAARSGFIDPTTAPAALHAPAKGKKRRVGKRKNEKR